MSELLRRAARERDAQADRLQGEAWLAFLDGMASMACRAQIPRPSRPCIRARRRAPAARRRLSARSRCGRRRSAAAAGAGAFPAMDGRGMIDSHARAVDHWLRDLFAWPWWLLALPLPWLARLAAAAACAAPQQRCGALWRPPAARRAVGGRRRPRRPGRHPGLARPGSLLCVAAARPQQLGEAVQPPQAGRDLMLAAGSVGQHARTGHGPGRSHRRSSHRSQGRARRFPRPPRRRPRRPDRVRSPCLCTDPADPRPRLRCAISSTTA